MGRIYTTDMRAAAFRHLNAAETLMEGHRQDVAGYLFGISAECALKHMMQESGMKPLPIEERREDPFFAHFEELKTLIRDNVSGRRAGELRRYVENSAFMQHWDVTMRYSSGKEIEQRWINRWRKDAVDVTGII